MGIGALPIRPTLLLVEQISMGFVMITVILIALRKTMMQLPNSARLAPMSHQVHHLYKRTNKLLVTVNYVCTNSTPSCEAVNLRVHAVRLNKYFLKSQIFTSNVEKVTEA